MGLTGVPSAVFMRQGNPSDPRAVRTRRSILEAYERQLIRGIEVDSVAALARAAGVSRSSFYCHFKSVEEVRVAALRALLDSLGSQRGKHPDVDRGNSEVDGVTADTPRVICLQQLLEHSDAHRALFAAVLVADPDHSACSEFRSTLVEHITIALVGTELLIPCMTHRQSATFIVGGVVALALSWLAQGAGVDGT
ncbi:HTH-type transcriptional regulator [Rhodococcus ruber BKS 20-38]|uniref:HTH-type transcriptional regulator n=2 Tax=Rhodococcus ruber TaxID=1830 RepID=M2Z104_9NOCA|nr:HTH-type transcriptional regulator [Rhodococcus ruber BKS 20-38]